MDKEGIYQEFALAASFPVNTAHRDETRSFVSTLKKMSDVAPKPEVKP